jgi:hypothetical protein
VLIGNGGAEYGVRGYISAYDAETGDLAWRWFTVPGDPSKPYEDESMEKAAKTWDPAGKYWIGGGGARRGTPSPTIQISTSFTSGPATARRGIANSAAPPAATISISPRSSR